MWSKSYLADLVVFPAFFRPEFCYEKLMTGDLSHSQLQVLFLLTVYSFSIFVYKEYNQIDVSIGRLVMSICKVVSSVVEKGYFLWPIHFLGKIQLAFAKSLQSCPTLCDPIDGSPPGSPVPGILQARTLEWVAISFSNAWKWKVEVKSLSHAWLLATPWTAAYQAPLSMGFSMQEYWSGVPLPSL